MRHESEWWMYSRGPGYHWEVFGKQLKSEVMEEGLRYYRPDINTWVAYSIERCVVDIEFVLLLEKKIKALYEQKIQELEDRSRFCEISGAELSY